MSNSGPAGALRYILTINGGSSSIKFAVYFAGDGLKRRLNGSIDRVGQPEVSFRVAGPDEPPVEQRNIGVANYKQGAQYLVRWLKQRVDGASIVGVGHRVVHGGAHLADQELVTDEVVAVLREAQPLALMHLPGQIALIEAFRESLPGIPQVVCFDTAFHRDVPRVAQLLPIPRRYYATGVRRYGFHGLSYSFLMTELERIAGPRAADGRVILAHLGAGASMAAVHHRKSVDTTMGFTPTAGMMMATRPGDLDPGLLAYLMRIENMDPLGAEEFVNRRCGLLGVSETTWDMRTLLGRRGSDPRAADAVALFCYQAKKWLGACAAVLGGVDTLVFSGGIGEYGAAIRSEICDGLAFLGIRLDPAANEAHAPVISVPDAPVTVRVIHTDEEIVMAKAVVRFI